MDTIRLWLSYAVLLFLTQRHSVCAQGGGVIGGAGILVQRAAFCFNNNLLYRGCNEAFRLNQGGEFKVPPEETDRFCNGPCAAETELVLECINNVMSDFVFYNRATPRDIRNTLRGGCSNSFTRGFHHDTPFQLFILTQPSDINLFSTLIYRKLQCGKLCSRTLFWQSREEAAWFFHWTSSRFGTVDPVKHTFVIH
ncbi:unnamed protein product [Brassica rapa subsp. trilocularis]